MNTQRKILVIEKLSIVTFAYFLLNIWKFEKVFYLSKSRFFSFRSIKFLITRLEKLQRLTFNDFPEAYYDVHKESVRNVNDKFYRHNRKNPFVKFLLKFEDDELVEVATKRALLDYTYSRVAIYILLKEIVQKYNKQAIFLPIDNLNIQGYISNSLIPAENEYSVVNFIRLINKLKAAVNKISPFIYSSGLVFSLLFKRGISFKSVKQKKFLIGFDIFSRGLIWEKPYQENFLYDQGLFNPHKILHVVRDKLKDRRTRSYFIENQIPYADLNRVKIPFNYFVKRIILDFYLKAFLYALYNLFSRTGSYILMLASMRVAYSIIVNEIFFSFFSVKVFIARDQYSLIHIVRTLILNKEGSKSVGFMYGDASWPHITQAYICMDYYCVYGDFCKIFFQKELKYCKHIKTIGAGIYGLDHTYKLILENKSPEKYKSLQEKYRIVTVFPSSIDPEGPNSEKALLYFYKKVLALLQVYDDIFIIIKPKKFEYKREGFKKVISEAGNRVIVEENLWTYELIPLSDLMICINRSTVGIEGLMAGKKVLIFDVTNFQEHTYRKYDEHLVSLTKDEFYKNVEWVLKEGKYLSEQTLNQIRRDRGFKFDGQVINRFKDVVLEALEEHL